MKKIFRNILISLGVVLGVICAFGLVLAVIGLIFRQDVLYFYGLLLASPLFVLVLPFCFLILLLMWMGSIWVVVTSIYSACRRKHRVPDEVDNC